MNKNKFQNKMKELGLSKIEKNILGKDDIQYFVEHNKFFIVGYFKNNDGKYVAFFKDFEREAYNEITKADKEEEIYDILVNFVKNEEE